jgi:hypothetical protein
MEERRDWAYRPHRRTSSVLAQVNFAAAAELKVFSTIAVRRNFSHNLSKRPSKLTITGSTAALVPKPIESGEAIDVLILTRSGVDTLNKEGEITLGSDVVLARAVLVHTNLTSAASPPFRARPSWQ